MSDSYSLGGNASSFARSPYSAVVIGHASAVVVQFQAAPVAAPSHDLFASDLSLLDIVHAAEIIERIGHLLPADTNICPASVGAAHDNGMAVA